MWAPWTSPFLLSDIVQRSLFLSWRNKLDHELVLLRNFTIILFLPTVLTLLFDVMLRVRISIFSFYVWFQGPSCDHQWFLGQDTGKREVKLNPNRTHEIPKKITFKWALTIAIRHPPSHIKKRRYPILAIFPLGRDGTSSWPTKSPSSKSIPPPKILIQKIFFFNIIYSRYWSSRYLLKSST